MVDSVQVFLLEEVDVSTAYNMHGGTETCKNLVLQPNGRSGHREINILKHIFWDKEHGKETKEYIHCHGWCY
jgi:hypothetical protein